MVKIVVPLGVDGIAPGGTRIDNAHVFKIAFGNQPRFTPQTLCLGVKGFRKFLQDVARAEVVDAMDGVEPEGVHVIFGQPVQGIVDDPAANTVTFRAVVVDGLAPGCVVGVGEAGTKFGQVVPFRPQMVIDHVEHDRQAVLVAGINQLLEAGGAAVARLRSIQVHAVVAPISSSRKFRHRHDFHRGDAQVA